jgi:hypothetical protein
MLIKTDSTACMAVFSCMPGTHQQQPAHTNVVVRKKKPYQSHLVRDANSANTREILFGFILRVGSLPSMCILI